ncbi:hypothetical protein [Hyphococcus luteus]|uniref:Uncharacterized protein n=1 Tax=Hyphococcus luteus TaxID=2058213 RepID=A0A2S7JYY3_9PROT|nr:hypothetical protein [Marinicaulis flavus]PQA85464.1 hypothetical protein CW354_21200 [Marinicaulis flavus]
MFKIESKKAFLCIIFMVFSAFSMPSFAQADEETEWKSSLSEDEIRNAELDTAVRRSFTTGAISKSRNENNHRTLVVQLPRGAEIIDIRAYMKNAPWPNNCDLGSVDFKRCPVGSGECPISWSKVRNLRVSSSRIVSANFHNWSDCNLRTGMLEVLWR